MRLNKEYSLTRLAVLGGTPAFNAVLPVGQLNFPDWDRVFKSFSDIFMRRYYTNHGPLAERLEYELAEFLGVRHALCMTNATIGLMIAAVALDLRGKVVTPAFSFVATAQSLLWAGLEPVFADVCRSSHMLTADQVRPHLDKDIAAILSVNLWGNHCDIEGLEVLARDYGLPLYFDSAQAFGTGHCGTRLGGHGNLEVFSFHATKVLNAMEGCCVTTNDDVLAARLRNIRSSYGAGTPVSIPFTGNGRFSEAQAAMGLLSLEDWPENSARNAQCWARYAENLRNIEGVVLLSAPEDSQSNFQYVVLEVDETSFGLSRDELCAVLQRENVNSRKYFTPGIHRSVPFCDLFPQYKQALPITDQLCSSIMQVPSGHGINNEIVDQICEIIHESHLKAPEIRATLSKG